MGVEPDRRTWSQPREAGSTLTSRPADAYAQVPMVSKATGLSPKVLDKLIARETNTAELGFLGSDYIDVLQLNEALAKME